MKKEECTLSGLFGTAEYFEQKIENKLSKKQLNSNGNELILTIVAQLEYEIRYDFICHERIKKECLENLYKVSRKVTQISNPGNAVNSLGK